MIATIAASVLALMAVLLMVAYLTLPRLVSERLPDEALQRLGLADFRGRVTAITPYRTTAGPFALGPDDCPALVIGSVEINYTPGGLRRKTIDRVRVSDVVVTATLGSDGLALAGLDLGALIGKKKDRASSAEPSLPSLEVKRVEIRSGLINLHQGVSTYKIPFDADLVPETSGLTPLDVRLQLFPRDQQVTLGARVDLDQRQTKITVDASTITLDAAADLIHRIPGWDATGTISFQGEAAVGWGPFAIAEAHAELNWHSGHLSVGSLCFVPGGDTPPAKLSAVSTGSGTWQITGAGLRLQDPVPVRCAS
jgi:hypothetical protein